MILKNKIKFKKQKNNYNNIMKKIIKNLNIKESLLLHSCCAPCSTSVIEILKNFFNINLFFYNPNIYPKKEYIKRKENQKFFLKNLNIKFIEGKYDFDKFEKITLGLKNEEEGRLRCYKCFFLRLNESFKEAKKLKLNYVATTLTVSPKKNPNIINRIGLFLEKKYNIHYLVSDFKKEKGYLKSIIISKEKKLYRQNYCGCYNSIKNLKKEEKNENTENIF